jgi:toxin ParE1/3/4
MDIRWSATASRARFEQLADIAQDNPRAAERLDGEIEQQINALGAHPEMGRPGRVAGTREVVLVGSPFVAVYRVRGDRIEILRFLHGAQRWPPGPSR